MNSNDIEYIISRIIDNANDTLENRDNGSDFDDGKMLAYYEVLDTIKNELIARGQELSKFGLDIDLDNIFA